MDDWHFSIRWQEFTWVLEDYPCHQPFGCSSKEEYLDFIDDVNCAQKFLIHIIMYDEQAIDLPFSLFKKVVAMVAADLIPAYGHDVCDKVFFKVFNAYFYGKWECFVEEESESDESSLADISGDSVDLSFVKDG